LEELCIISNVFLSNFRFTIPLKEFDFFEVKGIWSEKKRYELLGHVVNFLQRQERRPFATYTPSKEENYVISFLNRSPKSSSFQVEGLEVNYLGKKDINPSPSAFRTLTEYLNKAKFWELKESLWSPGRHIFYPKRPKNLNKFYPNCGLLMFRGPFYRYNVLSDGRIILILDTVTHYIKSEPFLDEIKRKSRDLRWFKEELESKRKEMERRGKRFRGIRFFYSLAKQEVVIDDVDTRPISNIPLPKKTAVNGKTCETVAEFLKAKYPQVKNFLDETQPGLKSGEYTFAPQFLHRNVKLNEIDDRIINEQTFHIDTRGKGGHKDINRPARVRWELLQKEFHRRSFTYVDLGSFVAKMGGPLKFPIKNRLKKPKLLTKEGSAPCTFEDLPTALKYGIYRNPTLSEIYIYSTLQKEYVFNFYEILREHAKSRFNVDFPKDPILLDRDINKVKTYLEESFKMFGASAGRFVLAIIEEASPLHDELTNIAGKLSMPIKCVNENNAKSICGGSKISHLENLASSIITRAGGIPWVLYDKLNYDLYVAVDIGRTRSEYWAMGIVYNRDGRFEICPGKITVGEDLDEASIDHCVNEAHRYNPEGRSLIFLRHGDVYPKEVNAFTNSVEKYDYAHCAIVSVKQNVPFRIFRKIGSEIVKPLSGDYYFLDEYYAVLCGAGSEEYEHGTPKPIVAEIVPVKGEIIPEKVLQDLFFLTYLNWGSPRRSYSLPAPLRLAHRLAYELSWGIQRHGPPI